MSRRQVGYLLVIVFFAVITAAQPLPDSHGVHVYFRGAELDRAADKIVGGGLSAADRMTKDLTVDGNQVIWREVRRRIDPEGGLHVFYRQHLVGDGLDAELFGSEIGLHYLPEGKLISILGTQFESIRFAGGPTFSKAEAVEHAFHQTLVHRGAKLDVMQPVHDAWRAQRLAETELKLVESAGLFRPMYFTFIEDERGHIQRVVIDGRTEKLMAIHEANPGGNCVPDPEQIVTAMGVPVRPEIANWRQIKANVAQRNSPYTHEADYPYNGMRHLIYVQDLNPEWYCSSGTKYTLFPLRISPTTSPYVGYADDASFPGSAAGDAMYNTFITRSVFSTLGRNGWNGSNGDMKVVLSSTLVDVDQAMFNQVGGTYAPANSVLIGRPYFMYNLASSLDLIAHEWGHGVLFQEGIQYETVTQKQLHEGLADVIGMIVEKRQQPSGTGLEKDSDWTMHEDSAVHGYARGADVDDGNCHDWVGPTNPNLNDVTHWMNDKLHRSDTQLYTGSDSKKAPCSSFSYHATGNMLNVVHKLMAGGGFNPICGAYPSYEGCETGNAGIALTSNKAGSIFFYAIQYTIPSTVTWETIGNYVLEAAARRGNQCSVDPSLNVPEDQESVIRAFRAVGYAPTRGVYLCSEL